MAILVAVVSWTFNVPTMRSRMVISCSSVGAVRAPESLGKGFLIDHDPGANASRLSQGKPVSTFPDHALSPFCLDDFRHGDAELVFDQHYFAARHQPVVDVDVDGFTDPAIEFE